MTEGQQTPAGWYPQGHEERYWDGSQWTSHTRPLPAAAPVPQHAYYQQPTPPKTSHTLRNVLLVLALLSVLAVAGCAAIFGVFVNEVDKAIKEESANDKPTEVAEGKAFERDGFSVDDGWSVQLEEFGGATIKGMTVSLTDDQDEGGRKAQFTFGLYDGKTILTEIDCSSNELHEGETSRMDCYSLDDVEIDRYDVVKVSDMW